MKICMFSSKPYDQTYFDLAKEDCFDITYLSPHLDETTVLLAQGCNIVCCFVNDVLNTDVLRELKRMGVALIALRCAGFNNIDMKTARELKLPVCRVPEYSPYAIAEHACALILDLNRNIHRAHNRIRENDYSLDGLLGFDLHGKNIGVVGAGKTGRAFINIMAGFGCHIFIVDPFFNKKDLKENQFLVTFDELLEKSDIISLHCPLSSQTHHLVNAQSIKKMRPGVMIINTSRGGLIDTVAIIKGLKSKKVGYLGIDVYEEESGLFFENLSDTFIQDDIFARLQTFPNVTITGHQAFFTKEALHNIATITKNNILHFAAGRFEQANIIE